MKYSPYSFSKLNLQDQCGRRFKYRYIDKFPEEVSNTDAIYKGSCVHNILEKYPKPYDKDLFDSQRICKDFIASRLGQKYLNHHTLNRAVREVQVKLDSNFSECMSNVISEDYFVAPDKLRYFIPDESIKRKDLTFYGGIDYVNNIDGVLNLIDWKTGKYQELKYQSFDQLLLYAIYFFIRIPSLDKVRISYVYVEHQLENDLMLERKYLKNYIKRLTTLITNTENSKFLKNPSPLCDYCPYQNRCKTDPI